LSIKWVQFPLHPETPKEGLSLEELFAGRDLDIPAIQGHLRELMRLEGLPYGNRTHTYNSRLAQELSKWGERFAAGTLLNQKIFEAYFVDGQNLANQNLLVNLAGEAGCPVCPIWLGCPLPQFGVPQNTHSSSPDNISIFPQNSGVIPV